ncbi:MAG: acylphosphatase, partial [Dehalococcoidales bacterium]
MLEQKERMMAELASLQAIVSGLVQGVFFRAFVVELASELGVTGYVRNLPRGNVEVLAEGERKQLEKLIVYLKVGSPASEIEVHGSLPPDLCGAGSEILV